ncbi:MAG: 3-deoxy-D-manno-octulosonate 8-phosphate phosphatase (KDO 8-P phosphatase) [Lentimonas sp.]|jgi:3-deoxy-D-manno-octulosonate 8-phosphate phosphatase (KDO 8-P phosphatase)
MESYKVKLNTIDTLIFDMDGVLTNGTVYIRENEVMRNLSSKDSYAIQYANKMGLKCFVISGGDSNTLKSKLEALGMKEVVLHASNKISAFEKLKKDYDLDADNCLFMGDDIPDIPLLKQIGLASCPQDAVIDVKKVCDYISPYSGGQGAVRDVLEQVLRVQNKWMTGEDAYNW